jgi:hypothetical protein
MTSHSPFLLDGRIVEKREQLRFSVLEQARDFRRDTHEPCDDVCEDRTGLLARRRGGDLTDRGADHLLLGALDMAEHVYEEVHRAALPAHAEHLPDRRLEARMGVGDSEQHTTQPTGDKAS